MFQYHYVIIITVINANNDCFMVKCNKCFSACACRFVWCQFLLDIKENSGEFTVTDKYR